MANIQWQQHMHCDITTWINTIYPFIQYATGKNSIFHKTLSTADLGTRFAKLLCAAFFASAHLKKKI